MTDDYKRLTAFKSNINTLVNSEMIVKEDGADYVKVGKLKVARVRIMGTIVNKSINEEETYAYLVIDDGTETIRVKAWKEDVQKLKKPVIGDIVELVGRVREWEKERYLTCEIIKVLNDPNHWLYHKYELLLTNEKVERIIEKAETGTSKEVEAKQTPKEKIEDKVLKIIKETDVGRGVNFKDIVKQAGVKEEKAKEVLKTLLNDGIVYEPTKHNYKFLEVE